MKESMQGFETPKFKELHDLITNGSQEINANRLVEARRSGDIDVRDFDILVVKLLQRTEAELKAAKDTIEKFGIDTKSVLQ